MKARTVAAGVVCALAAAGAGAYYAPIFIAKRAVVRTMKDPDSAQFRDVRWRRASGDLLATVCGEVNARNALGGYVGFTRFVAGITTSLQTEVVVDPANFIAVDREAQADKQFRQEVFDDNWPHCE